MTEEPTPSYLMMDETDDIDSDVIETFLTPMSGRGQMPKGQHPEVRRRHNQWTYEVGPFIHEGDKIWVDQCANPATPVWLQEFDHNLPDPNGLYEIHSNIRYDPTLDPEDSARELAGLILGCSEHALRQQILDNGYDPADHYEHLLSGVFQRIHADAEHLCRDWAGGTHSTSTDEVHMTLVQAMGMCSETNTVYGRIFQPDGASDENHTCREGIAQKALLAFPFPHNEVNRGDIFIVFTNRWVAADSRIFDAVIPSNHPPTYHLPVRAEHWIHTTADKMTNTANEHAEPPIRIYGNALELEVGDITPTHMIHPSRNNAFGFWMANKLYSELAVSGDLTSGDVSESIPDLFIPAFRDKRKAKVIDLASPMFPHYHDEIRCSTCNGKVLVKARADNKTVQSACPHCKTKKAIQFPHMTPSNTLKVVGHDE